MSSAQVDDTKRMADLAPTPPTLLGVSLSWRNWANLACYVMNIVITYASLTGVFGETNTVLSKKYQTLVTPAGWAFSIWGPIFIGEGIFTVAQMLPPFRASAVVIAVTPWWLAACAFQVSWTIAFAQEIIPLSLVCMYGIMASLLGLAISTAALKLTCLQYGLLRSPFSLHLGWIIVASLVNTNVQVDAAEAGPEGLLAFAIISFVAVAIAVTISALGSPSPDAIVCFVAAWAFAGIHAELGNPVNLDDPNRFNPNLWDRVIISGFRGAALAIVVMSIGFGMLAIARIGWREHTALDGHREQRFEAAV